jgi:hypothetical protein
MRSAVTAAVKQAGKALKEEVRVIVKDAAKEAAKEAVREAVAQSAKVFPGLSASAEAPQPARGVFGSAAPMSVQGNYLQGYPTLCACEEDARAEITVDGHRVYTCHSCAPRGQALRDYKTALEAKKLGPAMPRARPKYNALGLIKENQMAGKPRRRTRKSRKAKSKRHTLFRRVRRGERD